jgi:hypothetical protein
VDGFGAVLGMNVLAVDPGPHVGAAAWDGEKLVLHHALEPAEFERVMDAWIEWADVLVFEEFVIGGKRGKASNITIEQIGVLKFLARRYSIEAVGQVPGLGTKFLTVAKAKALGWNVAGPDHIRSAAGHLLIYLVKSGALDGSTLLS